MWLVTDILSNMHYYETTPISIYVDFRPAHSYMLIYIITHKSELGLRWFLNNRFLTMLQLVKKGTGRHNHPMIKNWVICKKSIAYSGSTESATNYIPVPFIKRHSGFCDLFENLHSIILTFPFIWCNRMTAIFSSIRQYILQVIKQQEKMHSYIFLKLRT